MAAQDFWTGRETQPVSTPDLDGGSTAEALVGPWHAVEPGLDDLTRVTSLCNRAVRVWGERVFDASAVGDVGVCESCLQRAG